MVKTSCNYCKKLIINTNTYMAFDKAYCSVKCRKLGILLNNNVKENEYKENIEKRINKKENIKSLIDNGLLNDNYQNYCNIF